MGAAASLRGVVLLDGREELPGELSEAPDPLRSYAAAQLSMSATRMQNGRILLALRDDRISTVRSAHGRPTDAGSP